MKTTEKTSVKYDRNAKKDEQAVLLVSSQTSSRLNTARYLQTLGSRLHLAKTGGQAADIDAAYMVDAIVIDAPLPDMPVSEMLTRIREHRRLMRDIVDSAIVPSILVSKTGLDGSSGLGRLGVVAALRKPLNLKALGLCVQKVLSGELTVGADRCVNICVFDPEVRALEFFGKLLKADDVVIHELKDQFDINAAINDEKMDLLIAEVVGLHDDDPVHGLKEILEKVPDCVPLVCTALHDSAMHEELRELGVREVITKPINPFKMRSLVRQYVSDLQEEG